MIDIIESDESIPISAIGNTQITDIVRSKGIIWYNKYFRVCTVLKGDNYQALNCDQSPYRIANYINGNIEDYNNHIIFQTPTCPLKCPYCYVDRLQNDIMMTPEEIIVEFKRLRNRIKKTLNIDINVLHMMGGDPAVYAKFWPKIRKALDACNMSNVVIFSDCLMVEDTIYGIKPWEYIDIPNMVLSCNFKTVSPNGKYIYSTKDITLEDVFVEAAHYIGRSNVYFTVINTDEIHVNRMMSTVGTKNLDLLKIVLYTVNKRRAEGRL